MVKHSSEYLKRLKRIKNENEMAIIFSGDEVTFMNFPKKPNERLYSIAGFLLLRTNSILFKPAREKIYKDLNNKFKKTEGKKSVVIAEDTVLFKGFESADEAFAELLDICQRLSTPEGIFQFLANGLGG